MDISIELGVAVGHTRDRELALDARAACGAHAPALGRGIQQALEGRYEARTVPGRDEETLDSEEYMTTVPEDLAGRPVIILDPMLATGGSLTHTANIISRSNPGTLIVVCVLAAPEGIEHFSQHYPDASVFTAAIDDHLNDVGFIVPGLGDAGDRQFGVQ